MAWIFQGNPNQFDLDDYLSRYPQLIYWRTNRYIKDISIGDHVFIWRAGSEAGAIAIGQIVETPIPAHSVKHSEALGNDVWRAIEANPDELKTGIKLTEIRLAADEGMVLRGAVKDEPALNSSAIITVPNGTVFRLTARESASLERLWGGTVSVASGDGASEGRRQLRSHFTRERSSRLRQDKLQTFREEHGRLCCEICGFEAPANLPVPFAERAFEVHHKNPLGASTAPVRTALIELAVLCANCHRAVHANSHVTGNYAELVKLYTSKK